MQGKASYEIDFEGYLGKGQFGTVYRCKRILGSDSTNICVKVIKKTSQFDAQKTQEREIQIMRTLTAENNPNIVGVYDVEEEPNEIKIYMEICDGGDLAQLVAEKKKNGNYFSIPQAREILRQIINGYKSLLNNKIIHRDLKPANILLSSDKSIFKITDFGMGRVIEDVSKKLKLTKVGSPAYAAPQLFFEQTFSSKADIFSLGVIFYELVYGDLPSGQIKLQAQLIAFLKQCSQNPLVCKKNRSIDGLEIPEDVRKLIESMLKFSEEARISWESLMTSPVLNNDQSNASNVSNVAPKQKIKIVKNNEQPTQNNSSVSQTNSSNSQTNTSSQQANNSNSNLAQNPPQPSLQDSLLAFSQSFSNQTYLNSNQLQNEGVSRIQRIKKIIEVLLAKGDLALKLLENLQTSKYLNLSQFQSVLLTTCLVGYKYVVVNNALGFSYCLQEQLDSKIKLLFRPEQLQEAMQRYTNDQGETLELKQEIENQYYFLNTQFLEWQNHLISFLKTGIPRELNSFIKLLSLQNPCDFNLYFDWFRYFNSSLLLPKLQFQLNFQYPFEYIKLLYLIERFINVEIEYPFMNYMLIKTNEIVNDNLDYMVMYNYIRQKRGV